jgi:antitoxin component of MazEF toxin-antitoxin module
MRPWGHSDLEYGIANQKKDKVKKWVLPVEVDGPSGEFFVCFPDDLLEAANLKEGDQIEWIDQGDGSYLLKKVEKQMTYDEAIAAGWEMTADGFWIKAS